MTPHQERVVREREDLIEKLSKLNSFNEGDLFLTLPIDEKRRLIRQARYMSLYAAVLTERIEAFPEEEERTAPATSPGRIPAGSRVRKLTINRYDLNLIPNSVETIKGFGEILATHFFHDEVTFVLSSPNFEPLPEERKIGQIPEYRLLRDPMTLDYVLRPAEAKRLYP